MEVFYGEEFYPCVILQGLVLTAFLVFFKDRKSLNRYIGTTEAFLRKFVYQKLAELGPLYHTRPFLMGSMNIIKAFWHYLYGDEDDRNSNETIVEYFEEQKGLYDCGLCCVKMVLKWHNINGYSEFNVHKMVNEHEIGTFTTPLWTIDLYCFLRTYNVNCTMFTTTIGVNPALYDIDWYNRHINIDLKRVQDKFSLAERNQWTIKTISITMSEIIDKFIDSNNIIAIILVDSNILNCTSNNTYSGHFIILSAYKSETNKFEYVNPSSNKPFYKYIDVDKLEKARKAIGTDDDLIFINTNC